MQTVADSGRPISGPECDFPIEKGLLLLGSIEFQIDNHLMSHGTRIDPETRFFMAQVRDAAGDAATKMLDEARNRAETAPATGSQGDADPNVQNCRSDDFLCSQPEGEAVQTSDPVKAHSSASAHGAATAALSTAAAILATALLVTGSMPSSTRTETAARTDGHGAEAPAVLTGSQAAFAGHEAGGPAGNFSSTGAGTVRDEVPANESGRKRHAGKGEEPGSYRQLAEALALKLHPRKPGELPPYPDPRAGAEQIAPMGEQVAAMAEQRLALSAGMRREVQRRLALARFDPRHFDGIFGPATRTALREWQRAAGIPETGYLNASALALLRDQTADGYRAMQAANKARARQQTRGAVLKSPVPQASPLRLDECSRTPTGEIVYGRGLRCDFRGLRQSIARLLG